MYSSLCVCCPSQYLCRCFDPRQRQSLSLESVKQLQHLRLALADFSLAMLGEHCAEKTRQAVAQERMSAAEIALEEFLRSTPEPDSTKEVRPRTPRSLSVTQNHSSVDTPGSHFSTFHWQTVDV